MMRVTILLVCLAAGSAVLGQGAHYTYPFTVECPDQLATAGQTVTVEAKFDGGYTGERYRPTYNWSVSHGTIVSGQGTPSITVQLGKVNLGPVSVTLDRVFGEAHFPEVQRTANCVVAVAPLPEARMIDEFRTAGSNCEEGFARLDAFFTEISNNPAEEALIVLYGDTTDTRAARLRQLQLRNHFTFRNFDRSRVRFVFGDARKDGTTQFWLIPPRADALEIAGAVPVTGLVERPTETFLYATEFADGIPGCSGNLYNVSEFAAVLKTDAGNVARIVMGRSSQAAYRRDAKAIRDELRNYGVPLRKIVTTYKFVRPNRLLEFTELWVVPPKR